MSLSSCVEELCSTPSLHWVTASRVPTPRATCEQIQRLMAKHGIDYDSHASYRFVEKGRSVNGER